MDLETPRDRNASFDPKIVAEGQTRFTGFDDKILSMYARGMSTREIQQRRHRRKNLFCHLPTRVVWPLAHVG